jgi:hypothetical protein
MTLGRRREMKALGLLFALSLLPACTFTACGHPYENEVLLAVDTDKITNSTVKSAIESWQKGNSQLWLSHFTSDAKLFDDGHPRDFQDFSTNVIGTERFTSIDKVKENGSKVFGHFHTKVWGDFKASFKFYFDDSGKVYRLDIAQADY